MKHPLRPFVLVRSGQSSDTAKCVSALNEAAGSRQLIGLTYMAMYRDRNYEIHVCGEAARSPTFALGAVELLARKIARLAEEMDAS